MLKIRMSDLCTLCLCRGRNLQLIEETAFSQVYSEILNEIPVYGPEVCIQICWECKHMLDKFQRFKEQVKVCYIETLQHLHQGQQDSTLLSKPPHLQTKNVISIDYPEIKLEFDALDTTSQDQSIEQNHELDQTICQPLAQFDDASQVDEDDSYVKTETYDVNPETYDVNPETYDVNPETYDVNPQTYEVTFAKNLDCKDSVRKKKKIDKVKPVKQKKDSKIKLKKKVNIKKNGRRKQKDSNNLSIKSDTDDFGDNEQYDFNVKPDVEEKIEDGVKKDCDEFEKTEIKKTEEIKERQELVAVKPAVEKIPRAPRNSLPPSEKPECAECGKVFSSRKTLKYHLNVLHNGNNRYPCPQCGKVYQWKSNLGRHIRSHKAREKGELYCAMCDKAFASVATYRQHLSVSKQHVSESEFSFACDECGKKFVNKTRLRDHIDWEHLQKIKFRCQLCNKPFKCHTSLYVHMNNVHRNKGLKDNLCHVCGKSYQNRAKLRYHIVAMHTSETPYQCEQCSAAFGWYSSLYRHVREVHYKMKIYPSKAKKGKKKVIDQLPPLVPPPHLVLPPHQNNMMT